MVLRLNGAESVLPGAKRCKEHIIWQAASVQGIAPPLLYVDEGIQFLISTFIPSDLPSKRGLNRVCIKHAYDLLERCHQINLDVPSIDYFEHIEKYWQMIDSKANSPCPGLVAQRDQMQSLLKELGQGGGETGLCHHDPVVENFVGDCERLYLIDWEYAANGLLVMDYAALAVEWDLDEREIVKRTGMNPELTTMAISLYRYMCKLWEAATKDSNEAI